MPQAVVGWFLAGGWLTVAAIAIQVVQANKMKREAEARADAAKGFQLVKDGAPIALPIVYGRAKLGGSRVYHQTLNTYVYPQESAATLLSKDVKVLTSNATLEYLPTIGNERRVFFVAPANMVFDTIEPTSDNVWPIVKGVPVSEETNQGGNDTSIGADFGDSNPTDGRLANGTQTTPGGEGNVGTDPNGMGNENSSVGDGGDGSTSNGNAAG